MDIPEELHYTKEHEWIKKDNDLAIIGITDYAQSELGDIVYVSLPEKETETQQMDDLGEVESVKTVSKIYSPLTGIVKQINGSLEQNSNLINIDPYGKGWIIKIAYSDKKEIDDLMTAQEYKEHLESL